MSSGKKRIKQSLNQNRLEIHLPISRLGFISSFEDVGPLKTHGTVTADKGREHKTFKISAKYYTKLAPPSLTPTSPAPF
jgi:hypothetical protein